MDYEALANEFLRIAMQFSHLPEKRALGSFIAGGDVVLAFLNCSGETHPSELCRVLGVTTARTANLLKALEAKGLVGRVPDEKDGRRVIVRITESGRARASSALEQMHRFVTRQMELLGERDSAEFVRLLGCVLDNIKANSLCKEKE